MDAIAPKLSVSQLSKRFDKLDVLRSISVDVNRGEFISIVGPSGCGKTTFLRIVGGLEQATSGAASLDGRKITGPGMDRGFVFQQDNLLPWRTIESNVNIGLEINHKLDRAGVIAPEASNNAKEGGHLIPTIAFGVPSGASMAVLLSAFLLHGLVPGPEMLTKHLDVTFSMIWSLTLAHVIGGVICLGFSGAFARLAVVPAGQLVPIVLCIMFVSAYQGSASWGDIYSAVIFGIIGWFMKIYGWPRPPLMLGFVLGSLFERYLFISVEIFGLAWLVRPVVLVILAAALWVLFSPLKDSLRETARTFRTFRIDAFRFDGRIIFNLAVIAVVTYALWLSQEWPWDTKLVPQTACYLALIFACLNLLAESFVPRGAAMPAQEAGSLALMDAIVSLHGPHAVARAWRHFGWIGAFLVASAAIGLLPGIALLILAQSRFEFGQSWLFSILATAVVTIALWIVFDRIFSMSWPPSFLGDAYPELRSMLRIM